MPTPVFIEELTQQCMTSPLLADLPLLFTKGQTVFHPDLGICTVLASDGPRRRNVSYRRINYEMADEATESVWVDIGVLQEMELQTQLDVLALTPQELDMSPDRNSQ